MGQTGSSSRKRRTLFGKDFDKFERKVREDSDYVTLVRVVPSQNDLTTSPNSNVISQRILRPVTTLRPTTIVRPTSSLPPIRPKTAIEPNLYSDLKEYLRPKSNFVIPHENPSDEDLEEVSFGFTNTDNSRPLSYANHCSSRCVCNECRLTRYHLLNWLLPNCTRMNAERLLMGRPEGTFLVRYLFFDSIS